MENKTFQDLLKRSIELNRKKASDYAQEGNFYSNFERSASLTAWFHREEDKAFVNLIGTKLARLAELLNGKMPKNESIEDSFLDLVTYCGLWASYHIDHSKPSNLNGFTESEVRYHGSPAEARHNEWCNTLTLHGPCNCTLSYPNSQK